MRFLPPSCDSGLAWVSMHDFLYGFPDDSNCHWSLSLHIEYPVSMALSTHMGIYYVAPYCDPVSPCGLPRLFYTDSLRTQRQSMQLDIHAGVMLAPSHSIRPSCDGVPWLYCCECCPGDAVRKCTTRWARCGGGWSGTGKFQVVSERFSSWMLGKYPSLAQLVHSLKP